MPVIEQTAAADSGVLAQLALGTTVFSCLLAWAVAIRLASRGQRLLSIALGLYGAALFFLIPYWEHMGRGASLEFVAAGSSLLLVLFGEIISWEAMRRRRRGVSSRASWRIALALILTVVAPRTPGVASMLRIEHEDALVMTGTLISIIGFYSVLNGLKKLHLPTTYIRQVSVAAVFWATVEVVYAIHAWSAVGPPTMTPFFSLSFGLAKIVFTALVTYCLFFASLEPRPANWRVVLKEFLSDWFDQVL